MLSVLALLLLGAVAAAGSGVGIGSATLRRQPASLTFTVAVTLFGLFAAGCLLWVLSAALFGHRGVRGGRAPGGRSRRLVAAVPVVVLAVLLLFVAGRHHLRPPTSKSVAGTAAAHVVAHPAVSFVPTASIWTAAAVLGLLVLFVLRSRATSWRRRRPFARFERNDPEPDWADGQAGSVARSVAEVRVPDPEEEPDPRRAVVAAYMAMTRAAAEKGAIRQRDETPSEFLEHILDAAGASAGAAAHLTAVFELARYTTRPVDESLRSSAIDALQRVRAELGAAV